MIVPQYWAEGRAQQRKKGRQFTVRRFGWSDASAEEAQANADARAREALGHLLSGEKLRRREPKIPYNGAEGVPIREEIVDRLGDNVITRNSYGARCLNTPNVLFADIDFDDKPSSSRASIVIATLLVAGAIWTGWLWHSIPIAIALFALALYLSLARPFLVHRLVHRRSSDQASAQIAARERIGAFMTRHPEWSASIYRTPAGLRLLATHRTFDPLDPLVMECFRELRVDPIYARMCINQRCFRARVSAKPWRVGIPDHIRPRPGVWPIRADRLPARQGWIERYESVAKGFAACRLIETIGSATRDPDAQIVQDMHDSLCNATSGLPLA